MWAGINKIVLLFLTVFYLLGAICFGAEARGKDYSFYSGDSVQLVEQNLDQDQGLDDSDGFWLDDDDQDLIANTTSPLLITPPPISAETRIDGGHPSDLQSSIHRPPSA